MALRGRARSSSVQWMSLDDVGESADKMTDGQLECHADGHRFRRTKRTILVGGEVEITYFCPTCESFRYKILDRHGYVVRNTYEYSEGYVQKGKGRMHSREGNAILRLALVGREGLWRKIPG